MSDPGTPQSNDLEQLRTLRRQHDVMAAEFRALASEHGVEAVRIARQIAGFPCDTSWSGDELLTHIGWHHKRHPPIAATQEFLVAMHERIVREEAQ
jgi:hypothetical protein